MRVLKKIVTAILAVVIFLSFTAGFALQQLNYIMDDSSVLGIRLVNGEYNKILYDSVYASLEKQMALVVIQPEDISHILTEETIRKAAPEGVALLLERLFGLGDSEWKFESDALLAEIERILNEYAETEGIEYKSGSAYQVYEMICDTVTAEVNVIPQSYVDKVSPVFEKLHSVCEYWYIPMILCALCIVAVIAIGRRHIKNAVYNVLMPTYLGSFTIAAASSLLYSKDYLAKTVLSNEMFSFFLRRLYNTVLYDIRQTSMIITAAFFAALLIVAIVLAFEKKKSRRHRHHRSHHGDGETAAEA